MTCLRPPAKNLATGSDADRRVLVGVVGADGSLFRFGVAFGGDRAGGFGEPFLGDFIDGIFETVRARAGRAPLTRSRRRRFFFSRWSGCQALDSVTVACLIINARSSLRRDGGGVKSVRRWTSRTMWTR